MSKNFTDWNDAHVLYGLEEVKKQIEAAIRGEVQVFDAGSGDHEADHGSLEALTWKTNPKTGNPKQPTHQQVVDHLLDWYGDSLLCQGRNLFTFTGTHWKILDTPAQNEILRQLQFVVGGVATHAQLVTMFNLLLACCNHSPVDMFAPRYTCANFLNGTLFLERGADYKYQKRFQSGHKKGDFLMNVIPLVYEPEKGEKNSAFLEMLDRIFVGETDKDQKIRAVKQMYGAMLCSIRPHLFLLHGPAGGGKSSLIIPATRLVHHDNLCSVEPHEFKGFLMESMVGKLVNVVTDIKLTAPIDDNHLKKIEDRVPVRIDRKFREAIQAPLPALHIFGANGIPPSLDGASGAHTERWTFIRLDKHKRVHGQYMHDFGNWVFEQSPQGILNFALEGLDDLVASGGHYMTPESGKEAMADWQLGSDPVGLFFRDAGCGELDPNCQIIFNGAARIRTTKLWEIFKNWSEKDEMKWKTLGKKAFYGAVREKGYVKITLDGSEFFAGIGAAVGESGKL